MLRGLGRRALVRASPASLSTSSVLVMSWRHQSNTGGVSTSSSQNGESMTYLDYFERWFGGSSAPTSVVPEGPSVSAFESMFLSVRDTLGLESWAAIMLFGGIIRLSTLYFSLCGERASVRMQCALPQLKPAHEQFQRVYYNDHSSALEIQQAATIVKGIRNQIYKQYKTSNLRTLSGLIGSPLVLQGFYWMSHMCENVHVDVSASSFMWCATLGMPDPLFVLPLISCGLTLLNLELTLRSRPTNELKTGFMSNVVWGARMLCLCSVAAVGQFRAGVLLYWIGLSSLGLLQPLLLRSAAFRKWFGIPDVAKSTANGGQPLDDDLLQRRLVLQVPTFSYLFEHDFSEHLASKKQQTGQGNTNGGEATPQSTVSEVMKSVESREFQRKKKDSSSLPSTSTSAKPGSKGSAFASSGTNAWRSSNHGFDEADFLPPSFRQDASGTSNDSTTKKR